MNEMLYSPQEPSGAAWRLLGEIEVQPGATAEDKIDTWLVETLRPLNLHPTFLNKILASARVPAKGGAHPDEDRHTEAIHMLIFGPVINSSKGQTWGFFRMQKKKEMSLEKDTPQHAIAFYLYQEGK